jgi:purine-nucleoside phosphorylase
MKPSLAFLYLDKYNISPADVVRMAFKCAPEAIHPDVILAPIWKVDIFSHWAESITVITPDVLYDLSFQGKTITFLRSGVGAPLTGDAVLALGCTPCERILFAGSVGGLCTDMHIGDLMMPEFSYAGDGFCRYLQPGFPAKDCYLERNAPDEALSAALYRAALPLAQQAGVALHTGPVFSTDTILAQFSILDDIINHLGCTGIEMETAAAFKAARKTGIPAAALFSVSDLPVKNQSLFSGRSPDEKDRRKEIRSKVLAKALLDCLIRIA